LILINWVISIVKPIEPLLHQNGFELEIESRNCVVSPKIVSVSMYVVVIVFIIPLNIVTIIYDVIIHHIRQSTRRIATGAHNVILNTVQGKSPGPNGKLVLKTTQNIAVQTTIIPFGGILYLILVIWHATQQQSPPESFYLLALELISIFTVFMMIALFLMNEAVKRIVFGYIFQNSLANTKHSTTRQPIA
jgi:hypothetical protein